MRRTDLRPKLAAVNVPAMGMFGDKDIIVDPLQWQPMKAGIAQARIECFKEAGHFIMLDNPSEFTHKLKDFLDDEKPAS